MSAWVGAPQTVRMRAGTSSFFLAAGQVSCIPGELSCLDGSCVGAFQLCDGVWDCPDGADEGPGHCPLPSLPMPPSGTIPSPFTGSLESAQSPLGSASPGEAPTGDGYKSWRSDPPRREYRRASQRPALGRALGLETRRNEVEIPAFSSGNSGRLRWERIAGRNGAGWWRRGV